MDDPRTYLAKIRTHLLAGNKNKSLHDLIFFVSISLKIRTYWAKILAKNAFRIAEGGNLGGGPGGGSLPQDSLSPS